MGWRVERGKRKGKRQESSSKRERVRGKRGKKGSSMWQQIYETNPATAASFVLGDITAVGFNIGLKAVT